MAGLRWRRVDLDRGRVEVTEISIEINGTISFGPPKTKAGRRTVAVPDPVVKSLRAVRPVDADDDDLVFPAPGGGPMRHRLFRRRFWYPAVAEAGLSGFRIHDLRHTAVALWIAAGASPTEVAQRFAAALSEVISEEGGWYTNFTLDDETFLIFANRIFRYRRGDGAGRAEAAAYGRFVGVPDTQLDWEE